jgi:uncharacterized protein YggE
MLNVLFTLLTLVTNASDLPRTITVQGTASVKTTPDHALIGMTVKTKNKSAKEAMKDNNASMTTVFNTLKKLDIDKKDFSTSQINLYQTYSRNQNDINYEASNTITIKIKDLSNIGHVIDKLVVDGINEINYVKLCVTDVDKKMDEARSQAMVNAKERADLLLKAVGSKVSKVRTVSEESRRSMYDHPGLLEGSSRAMRQDVPININDRELSVTVLVVFDIE